MSGKERSFQIKSGQSHVRSGQVMSAQFMFKSCQIRTCQARSGLVKSNYVHTKCGQFIPDQVR